MEQTDSLQLSLPAREAIKTGLSMAIACGVAMGLGWSNPYWACIAVAVISMPTVGESINKGLHRLLGTLLGGVAALVFASLFPQDRWAFILCLSLLMGLAAYRITISRYVYFWFICGYVGLLIAVNVTGGSQHIFYTATTRVLETALGIIVYALVSVFIWPQSCAADLDRLLRSLLGVQAKVASEYFAVMRRPGNATISENWYSLEAQLITQWKRRLDAAETEQFEIHEARGWWRQLIGQAQALMEAMELWREGLPELRGLELATLVPNLQAFQDSLQRRIEGLRRVVETDAAMVVPPPVALRFDPVRLETVPHARQAALRNTLHVLERIEQLTLDLAQSLRTLKLPRRERAVPAPQIKAALTRQADYDSFAALVRIMAGVWLAALTWIFIDVPGHIMFIVFVGVHSLIGLMTPQMNWTKFFLTNSLGVLLAGLLYVFVLPQLSGYFQLSVLLFGLTVTIYYIFWDPRATPLKMAGIMPFLLLTNLQPQPTYNFATFANNAAGMLLSIIFAAAVSTIPFSQRPEKMFLRITARYFRQAGRFLDQFDPAPSGPSHDRALSSLLVAMQTSVGKIGGWANGIDYRLMPANPPQKAAALVASLNTITYRFKMLADTGRQSVLLWAYCAAPAREWTQAMRELLEPWARGPLREAALKPPQMQLARLQKRLEETLQAIPADVPEAAYARAYRLLGSYRGLYRALVAHAALVADFDWDAWRETRF